MGFVCVLSKCVLYVVWYNCGTVLSVIQRSAAIHAGGRAPDPDCMYHVPFYYCWFGFCFHGPAIVKNQTLRSYLKI